MPTSFQLPSVKLITPLTPTTENVTKKETHHMMSLLAVEKADLQIQLYADAHWASLQIGYFTYYKCRDDHWSSANSNVYRQSRDSSYDESSLLYVVDNLRVSRNRPLASRHIDLYFIGNISHNVHFSKDISTILLCLFLGTINCTSLVYLFFKTHD